MRRPWRCRIGWHRWVNMRGLKHGDLVVERICSRCGLAEYAA